MADRIQLRRDTKANWESYNPILLEGEPGHVLDYPNLYKMGDGVHAWNDLPYRGYDGTVTQDIQNDANSVPSNAAVLKGLSLIHPSIFTLMGGVEEIEITRGKCIKLNGTTCDVNGEDYTNGGYALVPCQYGDTFTIVNAQRTNNTTHRIYGFIDTPNEDGIANVLYAFGSSGTSQVNQRVYAREGSAYAIFNVDLRYPFLIYKGSLNKNILTEINRWNIAEKEEIASITNAEIIKGFLHGEYYATVDNVIDITNPGFASAYRCKVVSCNAGDSFTISGSSDSSSRKLYSFIDLNGNVLSNSEDSVLNNAIITAPSNSAYLVVNFNNIAQYPPVLYKGISMMEYIDKITGGIVKKTEEKAWDNKASYNAHGNIGGIITFDTELAYSHFMLNVIEGENYEIQTRRTNKTLKIDYYVYYTNANNEIVAKDCINDGTVTKEFGIFETTVPAGATKMFVNSYVYIQNVENRKNTKAYLVETSTIVKELTNLSEELDSINNQIDKIKDETYIPEYYFDFEFNDDTKNYMTKKLDAVSYIQEHISKNCDSFFLISDYHYHNNAGNSPALLKYIRERTGISKLIFAGDIGTYSRDPYNECHNAGQAWDKLEGCTNEFFSILGNHEWSHDITRPQDDPIQTGTYSEAGVINYYIARHKRTVDGMDATTYCYYVDNKVNKVRYYFLHDTSSAHPVSGAVAWFGDSLSSVPDGYSVALFIHQGYLDKSAFYYQCDRWLTATGAYEKPLNQLLNAFNNHSNVVVSGHTYDYSQTNGSSIGIFCGHHHQGCLYDKNGAYIKLEEIDGNPVVVRDGNGDPVMIGNAEGINVFQASTDSLINTNYGIDEKPWFWKDFSVTVDENKQVVVNGTKVKREAGTIYEQCFYVVQIDIDAKKVYITAIGGDHDWEFDY